MTYRETAARNQAGSLLTLGVLCGLSLLGLCLVELHWLDRGSEPAILLLLAALCLAPVLHGWLTRTFDPFEPVCPVIVATAIYFILMPVVILLTGPIEMLGVDYSRDFPLALCLAALALAGFYGGYYGFRSTGLVRPSRRSLPGNPSHIYALALALLFLTAGLFALWIVIAGIPLRTLTIFSGAGYGAWVHAATGPRLGHLYSAQEAWPACVLLLVGTNAGRRWSLSSILGMAAVIAVYASLGVRARVLLAVCGAVSFHYLRRGERPALWKLGVVGLLIFLLVIGGIGHYRGVEPKKTEMGVSNAWSHLVSGADIATTTAVHIHWTQRYGYELGSNFLTVLLLPVPSALWPDKYAYLEEPPVEKHKVIGAAAAYFVEFYRSFGTASVVFGSALLGWICRRIYDRSRINPDDVFAQVTLALLWAYAFHMYGRNSVTLLVGGATFVFAPIWICRHASMALDRLLPYSQPSSAGAACSCRS